MPDQANEISTPTRAKGDQVDFRGYRVTAATRTVRRALIVHGATLVGVAWAIAWTTPRLPKVWAAAEWALWLIWLAAWWWRGRHRGPGLPGHGVLTQHHVDWVDGAGRLVRTDFRWSPAPRTLSWLGRRCSPAVFAIVISLAASRHLLTTPPILWGLSLLALSIVALRIGPARRGTLTIPAEGSSPAVNLVITAATDLGHAAGGRSAPVGEAPPP